MSAKRVLVLGGLGFIGGSVSRLLAAQGRSVTVLTRSEAAHPATAQSLRGRGVRVVSGDVTDGRAMATAVVNQDVIINLAGESGAVKSMESPLDDLDGNCRANLVLLDAIRRHSPDAKLVFVGSRLQYGRPSVLPVNEDHPRDGLCVHAVHKNTIEEYLRVYGQLYGLRYSVARVTNPYGPGQPASRVAYGVINRMIHLALANHALPIYGDGSQQRDYVFVDDTAAALIQIGDSDAADRRAFNVGSGTGTSLADMARTIIGAVGGGRIAHVEWPRLAEQIETGDFIADVSRIRAEIGWAHETSFADGIERTVAFHRSHQVL